MGQCMQHMWHGSWCRACSINSVLINIIIVAHSLLWPFLEFLLPMIWVTWSNIWHELHLKSFLCVHLVYEAKEWASWSREWFWSDLGVLTFLFHGPLSLNICHIHQSHRSGVFTGTTYPPGCGCFQNIWCFVGQQEKWIPEDKCRKVTSLQQRLFHEDCSEL